MNYTCVLHTTESSLHCKELKQVHPKGNQPWIFIGRTDAEAEAPILWPPDSKSWLIRKDPDAGKDWRQEEKGTTEDEMIEWHHWLKGHEFEQALGDGEGQGSLACCSPWDCKDSDTTEWLNNNTHISHSVTCCCSYSCFSVKWLLNPVYLVNSYLYFKAQTFQHFKHLCQMFRLKKNYLMQFVHAYPWSLLGFWTINHDCALSPLCQFKRHHSKMLPFPQSCLIYPL